jgi:hypothetical protein
MHRTGRSQAELRADEEAPTVARRLLPETVDRSGFNAPINYRPDRDIEVPWRTARAARYWGPPGNRDALRWPPCSLISVSRRPAFGERRHRFVARRLVAVGWCATFMIVGRPHPLPRL